MNLIGKLFFSAMAASCVSLAACKKDDNNTNNNVVSKSNVALSSAQEVPVNSSTATGTMNYSYNKSTRMLTFTVNWSGLTGTPTGAHIHGIGAKGVNAGIKYSFFDAIPKTAAGTYNGSVMADGVNIIQDSLLAGKYYMNFHTPTNAGGEIRGQMEF